MTDYFALLDQPRAPWLDPVALKEVFHRKTLEQHPDMVAAGPENRFAELNEAYQILQDPKRRLHHLLSLAGRVPSPNQTVPPELEELFLGLGGLKQRADRLLEQSRTASNALSRSLLKPQLLDVQRELGVWREKIQALLSSATETLREKDWDHEKLSGLYLKFAYLGRWSEQLEETAFQLSL